MRRHGQYALPRMLVRGPFPNHPRPSLVFDVAAQDTAETAID